MFFKTNDRNLIHSIYNMCHRNNDMFIELSQKVHFLNIEIENLRHHTAFLDTTLKEAMSYIRSKEIPQETSDVKQKIKYCKKIKKPKVTP